MSRQAWEEVVPSWEQAGSESPAWLVRKEGAEIELLPKQSGAPMVVVELDRSQQQDVAGVVWAERQPLT